MVTVMASAVARRVVYIEVFQRVCMPKGKCLGSEALKASARTPSLASAELVLVISVPNLPMLTNLLLDL